MTSKKDENINANQEIQDEMVGVLTAISIVSKRLASRLIDLDKDQEVEQTNEEGEE